MRRVRAGRCFSAAASAVCERRRDVAPCERDRYAQAREDAPMTESRRLVDQARRWEQRAPRCRRQHVRVHRAAHVPAVPQDGRGARDAAAEPGARRARGVLLAPTARLVGRGARRHLQPHPARAGRPARRPRHDLPRRAEQDLQPVAPQDADRRLPRQGELVGGRRGHQRRRLRGAAGAQRRGHEDDRRPVLHAARADPGDRRRRAADRRRPRGRPGLRHAAGSCSPRTRIRRHARRCRPDTAPARAPAHDVRPRRRHRRDHLAAGVDEPAAPRPRIDHRRVADRPQGRA